MMSINKVNHNNTAPLYNKASKPVSFGVSFQASKVILENAKPVAQSALKRMGPKPLTKIFEAIAKFFEPVIKFFKKIFSKNQTGIQEAAGNIAKEV